ncbi:mannose-1-phosphate guanylyltransferase [Marinilabiliaceae bacterium JC017]|nr:mannose-1-phosphate guanylyltransferase [Marinilabiliaceae bacterium JC017]
MKENTYCVIMAGGIGSRFWPISQTSSPKQFLDILGTGETLIQQTFKRFRPICPIANFVIVTSAEYKATVLKQIPELNPEQVLAEPARRNTAPCIAYANTIIKSKNPKATIIVTPADHLILNEDEFRNNLVKGIEFVTKKDALLTLGIKPHKPETGYGYIQLDNTLEDKNINFKKVKTFTEKPNLEMAKVFFESGEFYWNSGIFIWSLNSIDKAFHTHLPEVQSLFDQAAPFIGTHKENKTINDAYLECKNISIDYGVMEKASNVYVQTASFGWSDLGTWSSLHEYSEKDINNNALISGKILLYDSKDCIVHLPNKKLAVIQGLSNYIVVESKNALLICPKENEQQIKQFTTDVKTEFGEEA